MSEFGLDQKLQRSPQADGTLAGDRAAIYHRETRKAVTLNPVGTLLWQALEVPLSQADMVARLHAQFPQVPVETLEADVAKFVAELTGHSLLEPSAS